MASLRAGAFSYFPPALPPHRHPRSAPDPLPFIQLCATGASPFIQPLSLVCWGQACPCGFTPCPCHPPPPSKLCTGYSFAPHSPCCQCRFATSPLRGAQQHRLSCAAESIGSCPFSLYPPPHPLSAHNTLCVNARCVAYVFRQCKAAALQCGGSSIPSALLIAKLSQCWVPQDYPPPLVTHNQQKAQLRATGRNLPRHRPSPPTTTQCRPPLSRHCRLQCLCSDDSTPPEWHSPSPLSAVDLGGPCLTAIDI